MPHAMHITGLSGPGQWLHAWGSYFIKKKEKKKEANGARLYGPDRVRSPPKWHVAQPKKTIQILAHFVETSYRASQSTINVLISTF